MSTWRRSRETRAEIEVLNALKQKIGEKTVMSKDSRRHVSRARCSRQRSGRFDEQRHRSRLVVQLFLDDLGETVTAFLFFSEKAMTWAVSTN